MQNPQTETTLQGFIRGLPKAELHLHIEGTLEPELIFELSQRNGIALSYASIAQLRQAYAFTNLQSFLDLYYAGASVLITEQDFYDMTMAYLRRAAADGVVHTEVMFDPQTHISRGVALETVFAGIAGALRDARASLGITSYMIMSFLRHLPEDDAIHTFDQALALRNRYDDVWIAVGLDSAEVGNPPEKFARVFARCKQAGFRLTAHAGEEGPASYVWSALNVLGVERIDHGVRSTDDPKLIDRLINAHVALTVCPLSNLKLCVVTSLAEHNLAAMLRQGVAITLNSDDPAYFGGYIADNYYAAAEALGLQADELVQLAHNSFSASFLPQADKNTLTTQLERYAANSLPLVQ